MPSNHTDISICTAALILIGADEINSFSDETREAKVCAVEYPILLEDLLSSYPWHFTKKMAELNQLVAAPEFDYQHAYQLPSDMLQLNKSELHIAYEIYEDKLYTNVSEVKVAYQFDPGANKYPPYFVRLLKLELAAIFAVSLAEDESKAELYTKLADRQRRNAKLRDSHAQPSRTIRQDNHVLVEVRR